MNSVLQIEGGNEVNYIDMIPRSELDISRGKLKVFYKMKGWNIEQIAEYFNCSAGTIQKYIDKFNIPPKSTPKSINQRLAEWSLPEHKIQLKNKLNFENHNTKNYLECECGVIFKRSFNAIQKNINYYNGLLVCPSLVPYGEYLISKYLKENNYNFKTQYKFDDLEDALKLRFDFAVFKRKYLFCLIEHDGAYHNEENSFFYNEKMYRHDRMKDDYCKENDIPLLRIDNYENIPEQIESFISNLT